MVELALGIMAKWMLSTPAAMSSPTASHSSTAWSREFRCSVVLRSSRLYSKPRLGGADPASGGMVL